MSKIRHINWWAIAFVIACLAFELMRELYVQQINEPQHVSASFSLATLDGYTFATGRWRRIDEGEDLLPAAVKIECWKPRGECQEITAQAFNHWLMPPDTSTFNAKFEPGLISYQNDTPGCVTYSVRMDLQNHQVIAVRQRKPGPLKEPCEKLEPRIEMRLADGYEQSDNDREWAKLRKEHFVPLLTFISSAARALGG